MTINYHRQKRYGKPLPGKKKVNAQLKFLSMIDAGAKENDTNKCRNKISFDVINGRVEIKK